VKLKDAGEPQMSDPHLLAELASGAGYLNVDVTVSDVDAGVSTPAELAAWRLGMAHVAPYLASLPQPVRTRARQATEAALVGVRPLVFRLVSLAAS
jgi:hypothetical protein